MGVNIQTIKDIRLFLADELAEIYQEPELSAITKIVLESVLGTSRLYRLYMNEEPVDNIQAGKIRDICNRLKTGMPVQYVLGETIFYECIIRVSGATLIPRPETEELVDLIIKENRGFRGSIIDVGTGSGCIAIALAVNMPGSEVTGIDISEDALVIARGNAQLNKVTVNFIICDIFNFDSDQFSRADIIVSNPPYVRNSEKQYMSKNVLDFEPHRALFVSDSDPLLYYRSILNAAEKILKPGGRIYFEINEAMGNKVTELLLSSGYSGTEVIRDLNSKDRIIKGIRYA
jgi:release factor glutamine methyltransferase